jgi:hypothetical protein
VTTLHTFPQNNPVVGSWYYYGVDPGKQGGIVVLWEGQIIQSCKTPETERDAWELFTNYPVDRCFAVIERISPGFPGTGKSSIAKLYGHYRMLRAYLVAAGIKFEDPTPAQWQRGLGLVGRGRTESRTEFKNRLKGVAQRLYPSYKVTLNISDAMLMAEYGRRRKTGLW